MVLRTTLFLVGLAGVLQGGPILPPATANEQVDGLAARPCTACSESFSSDGTGAIGLFLFNGGAEAELGPKAFVSAQVGSTLFQTVAANATETYSFEFVGPPGQILVDVQLLMGVTHTPGFASPAAGADATFGVLAGVGGPQLMGADVQCTIDFCNNTSFDGTLSHILSANQIYTVQARAGVEAIAGDQSGAVVDPMIYIDPSFVNAGQYTLFLSDGVGNLGPESQSPVPEPGMAAFTILGCGLILIRKLSRYAHRRV